MINFLTTASGMKAPLCQCCGKQGRTTLPDLCGEPRLFSGWSVAPFPANYSHNDGSVGSLYRCAACNKLMRAGHTLQSRSAQRQRLAA